MHLTQLSLGLGQWSHRCLIDIILFNVLKCLDLVYVGVSTLHGWVGLLWQHGDVLRCDFSHVFEVGHARTMQVLEFKEKFEWITN